ncbi:deoxyguanosinetriphosphate triphosphohydrolase [mine drainage metagenome]|uniref:Deoxyguanosinetriphosphate triphosphohydrolase n=1 Tax=mine drainage metagenome TaxID=410659 RepID=A0A1J5PMY8_9ZZZZ
MNDGSMSGYSDFDRERFITEPAKRAGRTEFARDRARILHSAALRRLAAKTQVVVPWESDFPRTRLSHSLECGQVGRELGAALGADPDLVESACLAHDLGHPPFGHNGETALAQASAECGGFEGNAQSFRLLVRLEAKSLTADGSSVGLNLTRASLDAATKYPWDNELNTRKFGVYQDDREIFDWVRDGAPGVRRCLEAQIMDWSDDIAYSVHDFEDALFAGNVTFEQLRDSSEAEEIAKVAATEFLDNSSVQEVQEAIQRLLQLPFWPHEFDGTHQSLARLKDLTSQLIGRFAEAGERATRAAFGDGPLSRYSADLLVPRAQRVECAALKAVASFYVMRSEHARLRYERQRNVIHDLVAAVTAGAPETLDSLSLEAWTKAESASAQMRVVIDQIASLTDPGALALHARLLGS